MIDIKNKDHVPLLEEIAEYIRNSFFMQFCDTVKNRYACNEKIEYSNCSWEKGWNIKFKKAGKTLCTIYPRESYFTVMVVIGKNEKKKAEDFLFCCTSQLKTIYNETKEGNAQRWLMIDLEEENTLYRDILCLLDIKRAR